MNAAFNESDCVKLQFLIDSVVERGKVYLKFLDQDLQIKQLAAEQNDSIIYLVINDEPRLETAKGGSSGSGAVNRLAKLSTVLGYAFPRYRCEFQNVGVSLYAINKDVYTLLFDNLPNYNWGLLYKMKIVNVVDETNDSYNDRRAILQFLLDNSFCLSDLCAVSSVNRDPGQIFRYNLLCNNVKEYHEAEEKNGDYSDDDDDDDDDDDRRRENKLRGLFAVDSRFLIDRRRPIHALDVPSEKRCHYWAYWSSDGFAYRNLRDYLEKTPSTNPLAHLAACTIVVDGGRPVSGGSGGGGGRPRLSPVETITVFTTTPTGISFMFVYTTAAAASTTDLREWETSFRKLYPGQDTRLTCEIFENEELLLSRFAMEMNKLCFLPFSVTFHFLYGYDFDVEVYRPIMGRIMDLKLLDLVDRCLCLNIFEDRLAFNDQYVTCDLKQLASLVRDDFFEYEERSRRDSRLDDEGGGGGDSNDDSLRRKSPLDTAITAIALQRLWSNLSEVVLFATDVLDATVKDLFGQSNGRVPMRIKIAKRLERLVHNDGLEIGRYVAPKKSPTINDFTRNDSVLCKYATSRPPDDGETLKHVKRGAWRGDTSDDVKIFLHVEIADARARACVAFNASFENVAVVYATRLLEIMGIVSTADEYDTKGEILATIDATSKYVLPRRSPEDRHHHHDDDDRCRHELFDAAFKWDENRREYTVDVENVALYYYDSDASGTDKNKLSGRPLANLKQLLDVKDKKRTRLVVIVNGFRGTLCYTAKKLLDKLTMTDRRKDAVVRTAVEELVNELRNKKRSPHAPVCAAVIDVMMKRVMYDVLESVNALSRRRSRILLVDGHRLICEIPKNLENVVENRLQNVFDRLITTTKIEEKIPLSIVGKYDGILIIDGATFAAFENVRHRNVNGGDSSGSGGSDDGEYRIKLRLCENIRPSPPPPAILTVFKYMCDWVFFDRTNDDGDGGGGGGGGSSGGDGGLFERLVDLFVAVYVYLIERENQYQFSIAVRSDDDDDATTTTTGNDANDADDENCDKSCEHALKAFLQKLINERGYADGVVFPVAFTPSTMTANDTVNANNFLFHYEDRAVAAAVRGAVRRKVCNDVTTVNYHFFLKRYRKFICSLLERHREFAERFVRKRDRPNRRRKTDVKSPKEIVDDVSVEAFGRAIRTTKNKTGIEKIKQNHRILFALL